MFYPRNLKSRSVMSKCSPARKARLRARHQAEAAEERRLSDALRAEGKSCATCLNSDKPFSMIGKTVCQLDSDWEGYCTVKPEFVCSRFKPQI